MNKGYNHLINEIFLRCPSELVAVIFFSGSQLRLVSGLSTNKNSLILAAEHIGKERSENSNNKEEKCDTVQLFTYIKTSVLHSIADAVPKKILFFSDPHHLTNHRQALGVLDHSYHVHMVQFTSAKHEEPVIDDSRRLCGMTAGGIYLHRAAKDGYKTVREAIDEICKAEYKEYKAQLFFGHITTSMTLLPNPHHVWRRVNERSAANNGQNVPFMPGMVSILGFVKASNFKSLPELCRFNVVPYSLIYRTPNVEIDPLCLMLNELLKSNAIFALLSLGADWHGLLMHHVEEKTIVEKIKTKKRKRRKIVKQEEKDVEQLVEKEKSELSVVNSSNLKIKFFTDKMNQQSAQPTEPLEKEKEHVEEDLEYEETDEEIEVEKNGLIMVVFPPGLCVEWICKFENLTNTATSDSKPLPVKRGKKRSYDTFSKGSTRLPSISTDALQGAIKKIFKSTKALPNKPELLLNECNKLQNLVPIFGFEDIKRGLISRLKKARRKVADSSSKQAVILDSLIGQLEQNKTPLELPALSANVSPDERTNAGGAHSFSTAPIEDSQVRQTTAVQSQSTAVAQEEKPVKMSLSSLLS